MQKTFYSAGYLFTLLHVLGEWEPAYYCPDPDTTCTLLLHNKCAVFSHVHTLRPNTNLPVINTGINGIKPGGSCMVFANGHLMGMILLSVLARGLIFLSRSRRNNTHKKDLPAVFSW